MRLTGSFQTMVTHGVSGTTSSNVSGRSTSAGATLTGVHLLTHRLLVSQARGANEPMSPRGASARGGGRAHVPRGCIRPGGGRAHVPPRVRPPGVASVVFWVVTTDSRGASTALLTDRYELTMLTAALRSGAAGRRAVFAGVARAP